MREYEVEGIVRVSGVIDKLVIRNVGPISKDWVVKRIKNGDVFYVYARSRRWSKLHVVMSKNLRSRPRKRGEPSLEDLPTFDLLLGEL
jgi:hypothetical protein